MNDGKSFAGMAAAIAEDLDAVVDDILPGVAEELATSDAGRVIDEAEVRVALTAVLGEFLALLQGDASSEGGALADVVRRRFAQGVDLFDLLRNFRVGVAAIWARFAGGVRGDVDAGQSLLAATPRFFDMVDRYSQRAHEIYRELAVGDARRDEQIRATLLDTVFYGDSQRGAPFWEAAATLRMPRKGRFLVVAANVSTSVAAKFHWEAVTVGHPAVDQAWFRLGPASQIGLVALRHDREDGASLGARLAQRVPAQVGVSAGFDGISLTRVARAQAEVAAFATTPDRPVKRYGHDVLDVLLASSPDATRSLVEATLGAVGDLNTERARSLVETVRVWLDQQQSVAATALVLRCHRNTVNYRLRRFEQLTGRSLADNTWRAQVLLAVNSRGRFT